MTAKSESQLRYQLLSIRLIAGMRFIRLVFFLIIISTMLFEFFIILQWA